MKILNGSKIHQAIMAVKPTHIAVAYVGADWRSYVGASLPTEIIISPTLGTYPPAIEEIAEELGWDNVHLLPELHAKIYLGEEGAIVGSSNLTKNGLSGVILEEACVLLGDDDPLQDLRELYTSLKERACQRFPTEEAKRGEVKRLMQEWRRAVSEKLIAAPHTTSSSLIEFKLSDNNAFHVVWYVPGADVNLDYAAIKSADPELTESVIKEWMNFLEEDRHVQAGQWLLLWPARNDGQPNLRVPPKWMYVHSVVSDAVDENSYPKVALERSDKERGGHPPFYIGKEEVAAIREVLSSGEFPELLPDGEKPWTISGNAQRLEQFVTAVKEAVSKRV
jgi:hypothetical protein